MFAAAVMRKRREEEKAEKERQKSKDAKAKQKKKDATAAARAAFINTHQSGCTSVDQPTILQWKMTADGKPIVVNLRSDSMELWVNNEKTEPTSDFNDEGVTLDFPVEGQKARICIKTVETPRGESNEVSTELTVNGHIVPLVQN